MSDKMREEFEAKFPVPTYVFWCPENQHYMSSGNPLACIGYRGMWDGWKARQESLVIELPIDVTGGHYRLAIEACKRCIEAAGLKVAK